MYKEKKTNIYQLFRKLFQFCKTILLHKKVLNLHISKSKAFFPVLVYNILLTQWIECETDILLQNDIFSFLLL